MFLRVQRGKLERGPPKKKKKTKSTHQKKNRDEKRKSGDVIRYWLKVPGGGEKNCRQTKARERRRALARGLRSLAHYWK